MGEVATLTGSFAHVYSIWILARTVCVDLSELPVLITKNNCPNCVAIKKRLDKADIGYENRNVDVDEGSRDLAASLGLRSAPALLVGGSVLRTMSDILHWISRDNS